MCSPWSCLDIKFKSESTNPANAAYGSARKLAYSSRSAMLRTISSFCRFLLVNLGLSASILLRS